MGRKSQNKKLQKTVVIFSEGATEKLYFEMLNEKYNTHNVHVDGVTNVICEDGQCTAKALVEYAVSKLDKDSKYKKKEVILKIIVFDKDDLEWYQIEEAIRLAYKEGFEVLFTNVCFEYWLLRHYENIEKYFERPELYKKLSKHMNFKDYEDHKADPEIKRILRDRVNIAMKLTCKDFSYQSIKTNPYTNAPLIIRTIYDRKMY